MIQNVFIRILLRATVASLGDHFQLCFVETSDFHTYKTGILLY
jgi:hypothetical protein